MTGKKLQKIANNYGFNADCFHNKWFVDMKRNEQTHTFYFLLKVEDDESVNQFFIDRVSQGFKAV